MLKHKKYLLIGLTYFLLNIIISLIYYFSNFSYGILSIIILLINLLYIFIINYLISMKISKKGIVIGLSTSSIFILIMFILSLLFKINVTSKSFIYYLIIILISISSSILSKNIKK
jgi:putative membrane protein (TIGR04086 family)